MIRGRAKRILCGLLASVRLASTTAFADVVTVRYSGTAEPNSLVGFMLLGADADTGNLDRTDVHTTDIIQVGQDGKFYKTLEIDDAVLDDITGDIVNYKAVSNIELEKEIVKDKISFDEFEVRPVEENGVLYVPIEEAFEIIGGSTVTYEYDEATKTYSGDANNGEFIIVMGEDTIEVDWVDIELPGILKEINGTNMMPAYAIKYLLKTDDIEYTSGNTYFGTGEGVKAKNVEWYYDIADVVDRLPEPTEIIMTPSWYISECYRAGIYPAGTPNVTDTVVRVEIDGVEYSARQIDTNPNEYGEMTGIQSHAWPNRQTRGLLKGEIGLLSFKARATKITDESGAANVQVVFENSQNWHKAISEQVPISAQWKQYYFPLYNAYHDMPGGFVSKFQICVGGKPMTIQVADVNIVSYGVNDEIKQLLMPEKEGYKGIEKDHVWRQEAWNRIEKYRKEDIEIEVVDTNGNPVPGAEVSVNMTENEFMFGAAICESETLDKYIDKSTLRGKTLDGFIENDMNTGVPADMLKAAGVVNTDAASGIEMINEFLSRGKRTRGHTLFWDGEGLMPFNRAKQMTYQEIYKKTMDYIRPLAYTFKGKLDQWDVLNEPSGSNYIRRKYNTTRLYTDIFKEVKKIDPDVKLYVNETGMEGKPKKGTEDCIPSFLNIVKQMQEQGAPIDGIGIQAHCTSYFYPQGFYHQIDECSQIVDEVSITEYDFQNINDTYAPNHLEDSVLATFSHPKTTAFIVWGIEDSMHWRWTDDAPFFNRDWSAKPAYDTWKRLLNRDFATNTVVKTDDEGKATVRAFRGDYAITCNYGGKIHTAKLGNTVDGGSTVKFTVGNTIRSTVSNPTRQLKSPVEHKNMTEAKQELDSITETYYKSVILDRNFKGTEMNDLVTRGGNLQNNEKYQSGNEWGSVNGTGEILYGGNWGSTIIHTGGSKQTGDIRLKANGTDRYNGTELHHETLFYTLDSEADGTVKISTGLSDDRQNDVILADIVYNNGRYYVKTLDNHEIALEKDKLYTLDTFIADGKVNYSVTLADEVVATHSCTSEQMPAPESLNEVVYLIDAECAEDDIFMLHNARIFEYKDGEIIDIGDTDYETYLLDESMKDFKVASLGYVGKKLTEAPDGWKRFGNSESANGFGYLSGGQYFGAMVHTPAIGENSVAKGFNPIRDGETLEITFQGYFGSYAKWVDTTGRGELSLASHDGSVIIDLAQMRYRQYSDDNGRPFELWLLDKNNQNTPANKAIFSYDSVFARNNTDVKVVLSPSEDGTVYNASLSIRPRSGEDEIIAEYPAILTAEEAKKLDTLLISSYVASSGTNYNGQLMLGVKDIKLYRYGTTMYTDGEAYLENGEKASLGIMYDNVTQAYKAATIIAAGFKDDLMTYCQVVEGEIGPGKGGIGFDIEVSSDDVDYYKVFLIDAQGTISPYKDEDIINIRKEER